MSPAPLAAGNPSPEDLDAAELLERNEAGRLALVRARAEKWIGAITALSSILATALIIKGPGDATQLAIGWRAAAAAAIGAAIALLAHATYHAYQAAYGDPGSLREISAIPLTGLHDRLRQAQCDAANDALKRLGNAIRSVLVAVSLVAAAVAITWFAPTTKPPAQTTTCIYIDGHPAVHAQTPQPTPGPGSTSCP